jgi:tetratricopeptide (TPR) repeat protein
VAGTQEAACFSCHMPEAGSTDIPHIRITDHYIRKPAPEVALTEQEMEAQREFLRLQSLVDPNPTPADRAEGFLSYYERVTDRPGMLDSAAVLLRQARTVDPTVDIGQLQVRLWYLQEDYSRIRGFIRENPPDDLQDAWTQYRIGEAFAQSGDVGLAINHFSEAVSLAPANIQYRERLGRAYVSVGDIEEAIHQYDAVLALHPRHDVALNNRGYARLLMGEMDGAESDYAQAAALNPDNEVALASLASIYFNTGRFEEAKQITRRLMRMSPGNMDYERLWDALASESDE